MHRRDGMEGPSLVILRAELRPFVGKIVQHADGNALYRKTGNREPPLKDAYLIGQTLRSVKSWGKHLILTIGSVTFRVHFLMFGSYRLNDTRDRSATLSLVFENGEVHFYASSIRLVESPIEKVYDWRIDVMSPKWDRAYVMKLVRAKPKEMVSDVILDQAIFAGAGNIIKCEVLYNLRLDPRALIGSLSPRMRGKLVDEVRSYSMQFYRWKKRFVLKKNWKIYRKGTCPTCGGRVKAEMIGKRPRYTYYCPVCQAAKPRLSSRLRQADSLTA